MPKEIVLPALAADFEAGTIEEWHKNVGDEVAVGDVIADVSTDKAVIEITAEEAGTIGQILVPAGSAEVSVGTPLAILLAEGERIEDLDEGDLPATPPVSDTATEEAPVSVPRNYTQAAKGPSDLRLKASPAARRLARKLGVDLHQVSGTGPRGRIVRGDILAARESTAVPVPDKPQSTAVAVNNIRRVAAKRLTAAKQEIPHFYVTIDCIADNLLSFRSQFNDAGTLSSRLSINDFIIKSIALALREVPAVNGSWDESRVLAYESVNVSVAVSTPNGLMTPVIRDADRKSLASIATEVRELSERARANRLGKKDYEGGTFTVSNLGMYGVREFSAIINPPQAAILAVGAVEKRPVVMDDKLAIASVVTCTLSADHRVVDGAAAAEFLAALRRIIEQPVRLLVDIA